MKERKTLGHISQHQLSSLLINSLYCITFNMNDSIPFFYLIIKNDLLTKIIKQSTFYVYLPLIYKKKTLYFLV